MYSYDKPYTGFLAFASLLIGIFYKRTVNLITLTLAILINGMSGNVYAGVANITPADVTPKSASMVWASDSAVLSASVRIFSDVNGTNELLSGIETNLVSTPTALINGIVKVIISGLQENTEYYIQTVTVTGVGEVRYPVSAPYLAVKTAVRATRSNQNNKPITNNLLQYPFLLADKATSADGGIVLVQVPGVSSYPISAFMGEGGYAPPYAIVNMNNYYDALGISAEIAGNQPLLIYEYRGLHCPFSDQLLMRYVRAPSQLVLPGISELKAAAKCFALDTVCDGKIDVLDAQVVMSALNNVAGSCAFNEDLDQVKDGVINVLDAQTIMNQLGTAVPVAN